VALNTSPRENYSSSSRFWLVGCNYSAWYSVCQYQNVVFNYHRGQLRDSLRRSLRLKLTTSAQVAQVSRLNAYFTTLRDVIQL